ncbi:hypothetical protein EVAR_51505_1 [Eumeta japonica]|uniref:Uncharacterized protein n=1 Tax=Eumeta variegata TaxID=151549 RepID=A0A4C1XDA4_EUMVA|nr:hypothetical protein EVAR_51505_1 [Eumeta japonica]
MENKEPKIESLMGCADIDILCIIEHWLKNFQLLFGLSDHRDASSYSREGSIDGDDFTRGRSTFDAGVELVQQIFGVWEDTGDVKVQQNSFKCQKPYCDWSIHTNLWLLTWHRALVLKARARCRRLSAGCTRYYAILRAYAILDTTLATVGHRPINNLIGFQVAAEWKDP